MNWNVENFVIMNGGELLIREVAVKKLADGRTLALLVLLSRNYTDRFLVAYDYEEEADGTVSWGYDKPFANKELARIKFENWN